MERNSFWRFLIALCLTTILLFVPVYSTNAETDTTWEGNDEQYSSQEKENRADFDELFFQYMLQIAREPNEDEVELLSVGDASAGNSLSGNEKAVYNYLSDKIVQVASGTLT